MKVWGLKSQILQPPFIIFIIEAVLKLLLFFGLMIAEQVDIFGFTKIREKNRPFYREKYLNVSRFTGYFIFFTYGITKGDPLCWKARFNQN